MTPPLLLYYPPVGRRGGCGAAREKKNSKTGSLIRRLCKLLSSAAGPWLFLSLILFHLITKPGLCIGQREIRLSNSRPDWAMRRGPMTSRRTSRPSRVKRLAGLARPTRPPADDGGPKPPRLAAARPRPISCRRLPSISAFSGTPPALGVTMGLSGSAAGSSPARWVAWRKRRERDKVGPRGGLARRPSTPRWAALADSSSRLCWAWREASCSDQLMPRVAPIGTWTRLVSQRCVTTRLTSTYPSQPS